MTHLNDAEFVALLEGQLPETRGRHAQDCTQCRTLATKFHTQDRCALLWPRRVHVDFDLQSAIESGIKSQRLVGRQQHDCRISFQCQEQGAARWTSVWEDIIGFVDE